MNTRHLLQSVFVTIAAAVVALPAVPAALAQGPAYATHIIASSGVPGPIPGYRSCCGPEMALLVLGAPDGQTGGFMNEGSTKGFVEVGFAQPIADGAGNDFSVRVTDSDESFTVKVKNAQGQVTTIGSITGVYPFGSAGGPTIEPAFDLGSVGYTSAVSVIVENANGTTEGSEGPDIDAFTVLNSKALPQCSDKADNDGDNKIDSADPGCHKDGNPNNDSSYDPNDDDEKDEKKPQCSDGIDNDGDGKVDMDDPGCKNPEDDDESNSSNGGTGLKVVKSDRGKTVTHPEDGFAYDVTVTNTSDRDLQDVAISDTMPASFKIVGVGSGGAFSGQTVTWKNVGLTQGASQKFTITVQTRKEAAVTDTICNVAKASSADHGFQAEGKDCLAIKALQVKSAKIVVPKQEAVPVTAKTGGGLGLMATSLFSGLGWTAFRVIRSRRQA